MFILDFFCPGIEKYCFNVIFLVLNNTANVISSFHAHVKVGTLCDDETFPGCRLPFVIVPLPQRHNESYHCLKILAL